MGQRGKEPNHGRWILPGGKIEDGEDHIQAAKRESPEETGYEIDIVGPAGKGVYHIDEPNDKYHRVIHYSLARIIGGQLKIGTDLLDGRFFTRQQLKALDITETCQEVLRDEGWL